MKVLISGGAGFIGSHLADALVEKNYSVSILDNFSSGKEENIKAIKNKIELIHGDILDKELLLKATKNVDYVFHLAAQTSVVESIKDPLKTFEINTKGTRFLFYACAKNKVKKVIFASSAAVYGDNLKLPKKESFKPSPISAYGLSKYMAEKLSNLFYKKTKLKIISLRYFNVYGPRQDEKSNYAGVISKFISSILKNQQPIVFGDGTQTRDFVYVKDVVKANLLAMEKENLNNDIINIASSKPTSILDLIKTINKLTNKTIEPIFKEAREGEIKHSYASIEKAKKVLGFKPEYDLQKGLKETIEWYKKNIKN